ncbi:hypothetical protein BCR34DRAFT_586211 [Clohesyomyces aquaticus]|uniref:Rhodopsin domain-containing protein n=1 Tax=Clohesyomyces aquaticus TaxID=1231657 RepID=A0A1Y1ZVL1_9PLEO|nr:hypothetical protein BCR34DRAFT_586211 [Clohesyomyces aquaticus]
MFWNPTISGGRCISNQVTAHVVFGVVGVVIDIAMFILPIPLLWSLRVSLADKVALFCIFGAGISILRVECLVKVSFTDVTYTGAYALVWTFAEPAVGVSVACAPLTRPIFDRRSSDSDIELGSSNSRFHRLQAPSESLPSFVDPNVKIGKKKGLRGSYVTRQVQESGNWSQADRGGVVSETPERGLGT